MNIFISLVEFCEGPKQSGKLTKGKTFKNFKVKKNNEGRKMRIYK